jgi:hypothetical protein
MAHPVCSERPRRKTALESEKSADCLFGWQTTLRYSGRLPGAFAHPKAGFVDALVMYKWLDEGEPA